MRYPNNVRSAFRQFGAAENCDEFPPSHTASRADRLAALAPFDVVFHLGRTKVYPTAMC